jgi:hypothetical protein
MTAVESEDPLEELTRENEIAQQLVERLGELSLTLRTDAEVPPGEVSEGLRLLEQYRTVHGTRFRADLEPECRAVAMPGCHPHLDAIDAAFAAAARRFERTRSVLKSYGNGESGAREHLADELEDLSQREFEALRYEGDYPLSCLLAVLPDDRAGRVHAGFLRTSDKVTDLEEHIRHYLERPAAHSSYSFVTGCQAPGCAAKGTAAKYPSLDGRFGIRAPEGWRAVGRAPRGDPAGRVTIRVDFYCPKHAAEVSTSPGRSPTDSPAPRVASPLDLQSAATEACACCDPIPEELR